MKNNRRKGFTLLEVLLVVAIIAILAGIVILALNPARQLAESRNSQRWVDVNTILNASYQYAVDNHGDIPALITTTQTEICKSGRAATCVSGHAPDFVILDVLTASETYLVTIPIDPTGSSTDGAGYEIKKTGNNRITVYAPDAENSETISVTR